MIMNRWSIGYGWAGMALCIVSLEGALSASRLGQGQGALGALGAMPHVPRAMRCFVIPVS